MQPKGLTIKTQKKTNVGASMVKDTFLKILLKCFF